MGVNKKMKKETKTRSPQWNRPYDSLPPEVIASCSQLRCTNPDQPINGSYMGKLRAGGLQRKRKRDGGLSEQKEEVNPISAENISGAMQRGKEQLQLIQVRRNFKRWIGEERSTTDSSRPVQLQKEDGGRLQLWR